MFSRRVLDFAGQFGLRAAGRAAVVLKGLLGPRDNGGVGILTYHRVSHRVPGLPFPFHNVTPQQLRRQISGLLACGYGVWPLRKVLEHSESGHAIPRRTIVLTFDDGYQSVFVNAWPILRELNVPATVFVSTAFLDGTKPFPFDEWGGAFADRVPAETYRPLTTDQCRQMLDSGLIELGAHTHTHQDFRNRPEEFRNDLQTSVEFLESRFGLQDLTFAFPFGCPARGFAARDLETVAKQTDVICGLTTESVLVDSASDPFQWGRFNVFPWDTTTTLVAKLAGWYSWAPRLRKAIARALGRGPTGAARKRVTARAACEGGR